MILMNNYTKIEKIAIITFLTMISHSDLVVKAEELEIINLLAENIDVTPQDLYLYDENKLKFALKGMTKTKTIELIRMGYSILDVDNDIHIDEIKLLNYVAIVHNINLDDDKFINEVIFESTELTSLDKLVLVSLMYHMINADGKVKQQEVQLLNKICEKHEISIKLLKGLDVPLQTLIQAVKTMSKPAVNRIVEELIMIALSDGEFSQDEIDVVFPLLAEFDINLSELVETVTLRLDSI